MAASISKVLTAFKFIFALALTSTVAASIFNIADEFNDKSFVEFKYRPSVDMISLIVSCFGLTSNVNPSVAS